jgi:hypothetical protein
MITENDPPVLDLVRKNIKHNTVIPGLIRNLLLPGNGSRLGGRDDIPRRSRCPGDQIGMTVLENQLIAFCN